MHSVILCAAAAALAAAPARAGGTTLTVTSPAFANDQTIPIAFTCDGANKSPPLAWSNVPAGTRSIAVLVDDPDAPRGTYTHWLVTNLPPNATALPAAASLPPTVASQNQNGRGYTGPCPPSGAHRYHFHVFALDTTIEPPPNRSVFINEIDGHVLAEGELVGTYARLRR